MIITDIKARQILDSRGNPTVEADVWLDNQFAGRAAVPSGASTGSHEAHELRDNDNSNYGGKSVQMAVDNIHRQILPALQGMMADDQKLIDQVMINLDGTTNKSRLGSNAILAVSLASAHAAARSKGLLLYQHISELFKPSHLSLPMPMMNILNGGKHASNSSDFQEFMIVPIGANSYTEATKMGAETFHSLKSILESNHHSTAVGDEGGFTYPVTSNSQMLDMLVQAITMAGYKPGQDIALALDVAASEFFEANQYHLTCENRTLSSDKMIDYLNELVDQYPIVSIEDGLAEDDWLGWAKLSKSLPDIQLVGDDLFVTNPERINKGVSENAANAVLIKPNQIGTLTETFEAIQIAQNNHWNTIISHRSGETEDITIAHVAVGTNAGQIKTGSLSRSERVAKHNELMRLEEIDSSLKFSNPFKK